MLITAQMLNFLAEQWGNQTPIAYAAQNVIFDPKRQRGAYLDSGSYIAPRIQLVQKQVLELPYSSGIVDEEYQFNINIFTPENTGESAMHNHFLKLQSILERKIITLEETVVETDLLEYRAGFPTNGFWETPVWTYFRLYS